MEKLQQLVGELATKIKELAARQAEWTAEDRTNWEAVNADYDVAKAKLDDAQAVATRNAAVQAAISAPVGDHRIGREDFDGRNLAPSVTEEHRALGLQSWFMAQAGLEPSARHLEAAHLCGINPRRNFLDLNLYSNRQLRTFRERRAGMSTSVAVGGYTIPEGFVQNFEIALLAFGGPRAVSDVIRTDTGAALPWPTGNDTSNSGELLAEETTIGSTVNPTVGVKEFLAYKMSSKLIQISPEILQDSAFDMAAQIGAWLGERIGRIEASYYTTGTGSGQPGGCVTEAYLGKTNASATAITTDEVLDLIYSVDMAYRPQSTLMMHDNVILYLRKLKDGDGRPLWEPSMLAGVPDRWLGYPVAGNMSMASAVSSAAKTMLFGDFSKFKIRDVIGFRLRRLVERYADTDQEGFIAFHRTDSGLVNAGTNPLKYMLQAT